MNWISAAGLVVRKPANKTPTQFGVRRSFPTETVQELCREKGLLGEQLVPFRVLSCAPGESEQTSSVENHTHL